MPRSGADVATGAVKFGGVAWAQHTGIEAVEFSIDEGEWMPAQMVAVPNDDTRG